MDELNDLFASDDFNAYPVVDQLEVVGLVTKFDFLKCFALTLSSMVPRYDELMKRTVSDVMINDFIYVSATTKLVRVLQLMVEHRLRSMKRRLGTSDASDPLDMRAREKAHNHILSKNN